MAVKTGERFCYTITANSAKEFGKSVNIWRSDIFPELLKLTEITDGLSDMQDFSYCYYFPGFSSFSGF